MQGAIIEKRTSANFKGVNFLNSINVFPFELELGYTNQSERGVTPSDLKLRVNDYASFKRVFTGLNSLIALWKGSTTYKLNANATKLYREFKVGEYFKAKVLTNQHTSAFVASGIDASFLNQLDDQTVELITNKEIDESDIFNFFIVPKVKSEKWLFITSAVNYYDGKNKFAYSQISLSSVANKLETSGMAIEQYIHRAPRAGAGYAWPQFINNESVTLDNAKAIDIGATSLQLELEGLAGFSSISCYGSPLVTPTKVTNVEVLAPRLLLPYRLETPEPSPLNTKPTYESEFYFGEEMYAELQTRYDDWKKIYFTTDSYLSAQEQNSYDGVLETNKDITSTNPKNTAQKITNTLHNNTWELTMTKNYNVEPNEMTNASLNLKNERLKVAEVMFFNHFINSKYQSLPITKKHNVMWSLNTLPIIDSFQSQILMGATVGWKQTNITIANDGLNWFLPCSVIDYMNKRFKKTNPTTIDLNLFKKGDNLTDAAIYSGINSMGSLIKVSLTDLFTIILNGTKYTFNTIYLGQPIPANDDNGKAVASGLVGTKLLINKTARPIAPKHAFLIDTIQDYTLSQTNVRYSIYANNFPIWQGTYKTKSEFTGNIRDIANVKKLGDIKTYDNRVVSFPAAIVAPTPTGLNLPIRQLDAFIKSWYYEELSDFILPNKLISVSRPHTQTNTQNFIKVVSTFDYTSPNRYERIYTCSNIIDNTIDNNNPQTIYKVLKRINISDYGALSLAQFQQDYEFIQINATKYKIIDLINKEVAITSLAKALIDYEKYKIITPNSQTQFFGNTLAIGLYLAITNNQIVLKMKAVKFKVVGLPITLKNSKKITLLSGGQPVPSNICEVSIDMQYNASENKPLAITKALLIPKNAQID